MKNSFTVMNQRKIVFSTMAYGDFKDLERKTASDKFLRDKAYNIAKTPKYDRY